MKRYILICMLAIATVACVNSGKKSSEKREVATNSIVENTVDGVKQYSVTLKSGKKVMVEVDNKESASISKITVSSSDYSNASFQLEADPIAELLLGDLNQDGVEEIYLISRSVGSGSYATVHGYIPNKQNQLVSTVLPEVTSEQYVEGALFAGYMGHDKFSISNTSLVRSFPVYKKGDANANPTGGTKEVHYILKDNQLVLQK
ncbi:MAG: hypothetical protein N4A37_02760 [Prolixibacteraceae bacterium]|jgi:hypothetical protein|nr:hypothetical protein [Prolixibacteraceae bacterium]